MQRHPTLPTALTAFLLLCAATVAEPVRGAGEDEIGMPEPDPAEVIAYQGTTVLTQAEIDAAFSKIPENQRLLFIRDGARVDQLIAALLKRKIVAADAVKAGFDRTPLIADRVQLAAQKELAEAWVEHVLATVEGADYEALAHEDYLAHPERYRGEEVLDLSHILINTEQRSDQEALALATSLYGWLEQDPGRFDALVKEYSDDPAKAQSRGRLPEVHRGQMVAPFEKAAFSLTRAGQISRPVKTSFGYHIIRLNKRSGGELPPFEEVREAAVERARASYLEAYRERYIQGLLQGPIVIPEGAVEIMAKRHFGDDLELAPRIEP